MPCFEMGIQQLMRLRYLLLATAFFVSPAMCAQSWAVTLNPESEWAVTKVAAKDPSSAPYCALARKFDNNIIMTIARNTRNETSVAVDFQQPLFTKGENVNINLGPGRDFLLPPASNKAVVARIGADPSFFNELEKNAGLDMGIMGQTYTFKLPDMASASAQLSTCLMAMGNSATPTSPAEEAGVDNKIAALQDQISTLKTQRSVMVDNQDAKVSSSQLITASGGENADIAQKIAELQAQDMALRSKVDAERSNYDNLQTKSLEDKSRLALLEETQDQLKRAQEDTQKFRSQLTDAQMKQDNLVTRLEQYSDSEAKRKQLEEHLAQVQAEHAQLVTDLQAEKDRLELVQAAQDAVMNQQKEELDKTKAQLAVKSQELNVKQEELSQTSEKLTQTHEELTQAAQQRDSYKSRLQEFSGIRDKLTSLAKEQASLGNTVTSLKNEKTELNGKLEAERARLADIQTEKAELEKQVNASAEEKAKLEKLLEEERKKQEEVSALEKDLTTLQEKQKELAGRVDSLQGEKKDLQTRVTDLEGRVKKAEAEKEKLAADLKTSITEKEKIAADLDTTKVEKEKIAADLNSAKTEKEKIAADLDTVKVEKEKIAANLDVAKKDKEIAVSRAQGLAAQQEDLEIALDSADFVVSQQGTQIDGLTIKQKGLLSQVVSLEGEKKELLAQLETQKTQLAQLETSSKNDRDFKYDFEKLKRDMADISKERDALRMALQKAKSENMELAAAQTQMDDDARQLFTQAEELEYQRVDLNSALEFERQMNAVAPSAAGNDATLGEMKASMAAMQAERDEFKRLLDVERGRSEELKQMAGEPGNKDTLAQLSGQVKKLETENVNLLRELEYEKSKAGEGTAVAATGAGDEKLTIMRLRDEVKQLQLKSAGLEKEQTKLLAQVRSLEAEKQKLAQMPVVPAQASPDPKMLAEKAQMQAQIAALQNEKDNLNKALSAEQTKAKQQPQTNVGVQQAAVNEASTREIAALKSQLAQAQALISARQAQVSVPAPIVAAPAAPTVAAMAAVAPASAPTAMPMAQIAQPIVSAPETMNVAMSADVETELRNLLQSSSVGTPSQFGPVTIPVASNVQAWRWKVANLTGNAESHPAPDAATQNAVINEFLAKARTRCPGDFAVIENSRTQTAKGLVVSADIACVAGANGVAAAIAFVQMGDRMVTIAHEADTAGIPAAMVARDKLIQTAMK